MDISKDINNKLEFGGVVYQRITQRLSITFKRTKMKIVTSREFRDNQKRYFEMVDNNELIIVKHKNRAYKLLPVSDDDMLMNIPKKYRCDPYEISPGGDMFWADKRNVQKVKKANENKEVAAKLISPDDIKKFLDSL